MKVIKPPLVGVLCRTYKRQGNHLALSGFLAFPFSEPDVPIGEQGMWRSIAPLFPPDSSWDEGIPKDRGEVLVVGDCHAPAGIPVSHRQVSLGIGPVAKVLDVYGDRFWNRDRGLLRRSDPQPFLSMPVDFAHSFGGPGYGPNPTGKGFGDLPEGSPRPLPNIEDPLRPLSSPDDRVDPAGFGPLGLTWTGRFGKVGKYRSTELGKEPPPLPADSDWTLFNQAHPDQWLPGMWRGGEAFSLSGFRAEAVPQEGVLPRIRIRSFITFRDGGMVEATMVPETVWLFPGLSIGVVIHRGSIPLESDDTSEIRTILFGAEDPFESRSIDHYLAVRDLRESRKSKDLSRFSDAPLLPQRLKNDPRADLFDAERLVQQSAAKPTSPPPRWVSRKLDEVQASLDNARDSLSKRPPLFAEGLQPDPNKTFLDRLAELNAGDQKFKEIREKIENPAPSAAPEDLRSLQKEKEEIFLKMKADAEVSRQKAVQQFEAAIDKIPPNTLAKTGTTREELLSKLDKLKGLPDTPSKTQAPKKLCPSIEELLGKERILTSMRSERDRLAGSLPEEVPVSSAISEKIAQIDASIESTSKMLDKMSATLPQPDISSIVRILHQFPPPDPDIARATELRQIVLEELSRGGGQGGRFKDRDLRGADLSGLDLTGVDFSDADLIGASFSGSILTDAKFFRAWAAHADLSGCTLDRTNFSGASLGCADLSGARGKGTAFSKGFLSGALFADSAISDGDFSGADLFHIVFLRSSVHRGTFLHAKFLRVGSLPYPPSKGLPASEDVNTRIPIEDTDFSGSDFTKAVFMKVDFLRSNFSGCRLDKATFLECTGSGTRFDGASLKKSCFPNSTDFRRSFFLKADLSGANLRGLDLEGSDFREACLDGMDGSEGVFRYANLSGTVARKSRFQKSDLRFANGRGGNFMQALFLKADLRGADFSRSSLYKAGFTGAKIDASTLWDHALTGKTTLAQERPL